MGVLFSIFVFFSYVLQAAPEKQIPSGIQALNEQTNRFVADKGFGPKLGLPSVPFRVDFPKTWEYELPTPGVPTLNYFKILHRNADGKIDQEISFGHLKAPAEIPVDRYFPYLGQELAKKILYHLPEAKLISSETLNLKQLGGYLISIKYRVGKMEKNFEEDVPGKYLLLALLLKRPPPFPHGLLLTVTAHQKTVGAKNTKDIFNKGEMGEILGSLYFING